MTLRINGEEIAFEAGADGLPVEEMLARLGLERLPVIVELNGIALVRSEWATARATDGDRVEVIRLAAGG